MNVALVYDRVNKWGGAERVLLALHKIWPTAPLFTAVYDKKRASWADVFRVHPSFLQRIPFAKYAHESLLGLTPIAFESFTFDEYDVVLSVTSAEAKNVITKPDTLHICYCLTPTRYLWSGFTQYMNQPGFGIWSWGAAIGLRSLAPVLRAWDIVAASRPDYYIAISHRVKKRIEMYYHREVIDVIYPPVDTTRFQRRRAGRGTKKGSYFLTVSRLVSYKRLDVLIHAFNHLGLPLIIIGDGRQKRELSGIAQSNIQFIDRHLTDSELVRYYEGCRAFVYAADEDFGLAAAEAQAIGIPVIAYRQSGVAEIVKDHVSGILFEHQTADSLIQAVTSFQAEVFTSAACRKQVEDMDEKSFRRRIRAQVVTLYQKNKHI
ncbi:MAG: glycosyltransferase [Patescibacteria group bacterium]